MIEKLPSKYIDNLITDDEFEEELNTSGLGKKYKEEVGEVKKNIKRDLKKEDKKFQQQLLKEIQRAEFHDQLLSMAIAPFLNPTIKEKLGYRFVRCAPLLEKNIKNLDFLIFKDSEKRPIAIFGEVKGSISNPNQVIQEFFERKKVIEKNREYILKNYLKTKKDVIFEYVLVVFSRDAIHMKKAIEDKGGGIILWSADLVFSDLHLIASDKNSIKSSMLHADHDLCTTLDGLQTYLKIPIHYIQTHVVIRMRALLAVKEYHSAIVGISEQKFEKNEIDLYLEKTLHYLPKELRVEERDHIIQTAIELRLMKNEGDDYYFLTKSRGMKGQTKEFQSVWISKKATKNHEEKILEKVEPIRQKYKKLDDQQQPLSRFLENNSEE